MKKLLLILLCLPMIGFGQEWTFGGVQFDFAYSVQQTTDGGYIMTGATNSNASGVYLIKTDGNGIEQWSKNFGGYSGGSSVQQTTDGGYIISGFTISFGSYDDDVYLIKTDDNGVEQWSKTFGGTSSEEGRSVQQTTDGGYIIAGSTESYGNVNDADVYLIKTDGNGIEQWSKTFGGTELDVAYSVQQTTDGGYTITGHTRDSGYDEFYLIKTDGNGIEQWSKTFGGNGFAVGLSGQQTTDGGYIMTGATNSIGGGLADVCLIKTDGSGIEQWSKTFGGTEVEQCFSVQQTTDGGYIIAGDTESFGNGGRDVYLIKTDGNGVEQWSKTFGGIADDEGKSVQQTNDGGYIITGSTESYGNGNLDVYLIKTDGQGNVTSTFNIPINPNRKLEKTVDILGKQTKPKTNTPFIEIYDNGTVEKRIVIE